MGIMGNESAYDLLDHNTIEAFYHLRVRPNYTLCKLYIAIPWIGKGKRTGSGKIGRNEAFLN